MSESSMEATSSLRAKLIRKLEANHSLIEVNDTKLFDFNMIADIIEITWPNADKAWLEALRSGRYRQGYKQLRKVEGEGPMVSYCCLGVACEIKDLRREGDRYYYGQESSLTRLPTGLDLGIVGNAGISSWDAVIARLRDGSLWPEIA